MVVNAMGMSSSIAYERWDQRCYEVRVRGTIFLWGSAGVIEDLRFDRPIMLHIRNDVFGAAITFGTQVASGTRTTIGTLQPGECVSIAVQDMAGVFATCAQE